MPLLSQYTQGYLGYLAVLSLACTIVVIRSRKKDKVIVTKDFRKFQRGYLIVYFIAMMSDWLQGPYVYALYASYGFSRGDIAFLFIAGFGSSMVFGTVVGSFADRYGRRYNCLLFGLLYGCSCITKHFNNYSILLLGRVVGGVATSILFSAFESWMVAEHKNAAFPEEWISHTFASMTFGNGVVAILSGIIASAAAGMFGFVAPFDVALVCLIFGTGVIYTTWKENYGDKNSAPALNLKQGFDVLQNNPKVALLGLIQSCFESCMYIFVFMWTPILEQSTPKGEKLPHGLVFASFMVSMMIGSNIFKALMKIGPPEDILRYCYLIGACCMAVPVFVKDQTLLMVAFCCFEFICGIYFPGMGVMRSQYVPEEVRATVMNLFRIGLNFIVVVVLNSIERMRNESVFLLCISLLCCSALCQQYLFQATQGSKAEQAEMMAELQGQDVPEDKLESGEGAGVASEEGGKTEAPVAGKSD
jgi:MFS family permease